MDGDAGLNAPSTVESGGTKAGPTGSLTVNRCIEGGIGAGLALNQPARLIGPIGAKCAGFVSKGRSAMPGNANCKRGKMGGGTQKCGLSM